MNRCENCHDLPKPEAHPADRWPVIMSYVGPRAKLTIEQGLHVTAYLNQMAPNSAVRLK